MAAGMKTWQNGQLVPWATITSAADLPSLRQLQRTLIGHQFNPVVWRPAGTMYLMCAIDHWRKVSGAYQPVWALYYEQQTYNTVVSGDPAYRAVQANNFFWYKDDTGVRQKYAVHPPMDKTHRYFIETDTTSTLLARTDLGSAPDGALGGGIPSGTIKRSEWRYDATWASRYSGTTRLYLQGYAYSTTLNKSDMRGEFNTSSWQWEPKAGTTEADYFVG